MPPARRALLLGALVFGAVPHARAQPARLALSPANTTIRFSIGALGLFTLEGRFTRFAGALVLDPARPEATEVAVLVDTTSIEAEGASAEAARDLDLLRTREFPTMAFQAQGARLAADGTALLEGRLTLAGVTRPLMLSARREPGRLLGTGVIERGAHGLTALRPILADRVRLWVEVRLDPG